MVVFRVADRRFPIFDGTGALLVGGRWNSPGRPVIYAAETFAGALLEILVHSNLGRVPKTHAAIEISIPDRVSVEILDALKLPKWDAEDQIASCVLSEINGSSPADQRFSWCRAQSPRSRTQRPDQSSTS